MRTIAVFVVVLAAAGFGPRPILAQDAPPRHLSASFGLFSYQPAVQGDPSILSPLLAVRGMMPVSSVLVLEAGIVASRPNQAGESAVFLAPEAQVQLALPFVRFVPYMGLGMGAVLDTGGPEASGSDLSMTISGSLGARFWLTQRMGLQTEYRGRGIGFDFGRSSSEYSLGLAWRM